MGLSLIAAVDFTMLVVIFEVALALGAVIFVHELGHFVVAKLCGVKCEKFYLGFQIAGLKLARFRWGETEYGIGILPLGGYVKMLGQEDNPARLREEIERAKQQQTASTAAAAEAADGAPTEKTAEAEATIDIAAAEQALYDPRSYLAKSVPQRLAIISAGVVMNVIFAFCAAVVAYSMGVTQVQPIVGRVSPGLPAWEMGFRIGDRIEQIGGRPIEQFDDLRKEISLGNPPEGGLPIVLSRVVDGKTVQIEKRVKPMVGGLMPIIGLAPSPIPTLAKESPAVAPGSAAAKAEPVLEPGDVITRAGDQSIVTFANLQGYLARHADEPISLTVSRGSSEEKITLPPNPMRRLGLVMNMGKISDLEEGGPGAQAGLKVDDLIRNYSVEPGVELPLGDPMTFPARLRKLAGKTIELGVERGNTIEKIPVTLRVADWYEQPAEGNPVSVPELGIAYRVLNRVGEVVPGGPAEKAGLKPGDVVKQAKFVLPTSMNEAEKKYVSDSGWDKAKAIEFGEKQRNWPFLMNLLQAAPPDTAVELTIDGESQPKTIVPVDADDWFNPDRGLILEPDLFVRKAKTWGEAIYLGGRETWESLTMVVKFLRKLTGGDISLRGLGGPVTIAKIAGYAAYAGIPTLLIFLTMLSANLAVLNFLPIPVLDGGHVVFLLYEGIRGKPADERVQIVLTYIGMALLLALMVLVFGLDLEFISRHVPIED